MNMITVDTDYFDITSCGDYFIKLECSNVTFNINKDINCNIVYFNNKGDYKLLFNVLDNSNVNVYSLCKDCNFDIDINLSNYSKIMFNNSVISFNDSIFNININHSDNSSSFINNNGINYGSKLYFNINGVINKDLVKVTSDQKSMIINYKDGDSKIIPNFIIDSYDVVCNHSAFIGEFSKDNIFYMRSRGFSDNSIIEYLSMALLLKNFDIFKDEACEIIKEWW